MKTLLSLFLLLAVGASAAVLGTRFSEYPNVAGLTNSELFLVAVTNVMPPTNKNITYGQLRSLLSSNNFVGSFTGTGTGLTIAASNVVSGGTLSVSNVDVAGNISASGAVIATNGLIPKMLGSSSQLENIFIGYSAAGNNAVTNNPNLGIGRASLWSLRGGTANCFVGDTTGNKILDGNRNSGFGTHVVSVATNLENFTGVGVGSYEHLDQGTNDTGIGMYSGVSMVLGDDNVFIGPYSAYGQTIGYRNTYVGSQSSYAKMAGNDNIQIGYAVGSALDVNYDTNGAFNVWIGNNSGPGGATARSLTNSITIGYNSKVNSDNELSLGGSGSLAVNGNIYGEFSSKMLVLTNGPSPTLHVNTNALGVSAIAYYVGTATDAAGTIAVVPQTDGGQCYFLTNTFSSALPTVPHVIITPVIHGPYVAAAKWSYNWASPVPVVSTTNFILYAYQHTDSNNSTSLWTYVVFR